MTEDLRKKVQWCPLVNACPRWDSSKEKCKCPFVREIMETDIGKKLWKEVITGRNADSQEVS